MKNKTIQFFQLNWKIILGWSLVSASIVSMYLFRLGGFVRGDNNFETRDGLRIDGLDTVIQDIAYAPVKISQLIALKIDEPNVTLTRLISAGLVLLSILLFYLLLRKWHTVRVSLIATILFASSSYSLHLGRFSQYESLLYVFIPALLLFGTWLQTKRTIRRLPIAFIAAALLIYIPGVIFIYTAIAYFFKKRLLLAWKFTSAKFRAITIVGSILAVLPLLYAVITNPAQLTRLFGIDRLIEEGAGSSLQILVNIPLSLFWNGSTEASYRWLTGTPVLDVATIGLVVLGIYAYLKGPHTLRARLLLGLTLATILIVMFSSVVSIALLLPILYIVSASGIAFLLSSWFTVFPRNPAARTAGVVMCCLLGLFIVSYHTQRYFIAWPNASETRRVLSPENQAQ